MGVSALMSSGYIIAAESELEGQPCLCFQGDLVKRVVHVTSSTYFVWYLADFPHKISASNQLSRLPVYSRVTHCVCLGWLSPLSGDDQLNF